MPNEASATPRANGTIASPEIGRIVLAERRYQVVRDFGAVPADLPKARVSQVAVDARERLHVLRRGPSSVQVFDAEGGFLFGYGAGAIFDGHGITIDHRDRVFVVDRDAHQILVFSSDGAPDMALGTRHEARWSEPFNHPCKVAMALDGDIYVADGYGNARVHRFDSSGKLVHSFGSLGHGSGAFMTPHAVLVDRLDRVLVCDRENDRVQVFTRSGVWLANWDGLCRPMDLCEMPDGTILVTDQVPSVVAFAPDGQRIGRARPSLNGAHGIARSASGVIYLAEIEPTSVTKLLPER